MVLYSPAHVEPDPDFTSDDEADESSVSDENAKRKRDSQPSSNGSEEDVSDEVTAPRIKDGVDEASSQLRAELAEYLAKHDHKRSKTYRSL